MKLSINTKLYKCQYNGEVISYVVTKIMDNDRYQATCLECNHGWDCIIIIEPNNENSFKYVAMINDNKNNSQANNHSDSPYFISEFMAKLHFINKKIKQYNEERENLEDELCLIRKNIRKETNNLVNLYKEQSNESTMDIYSPRGTKVIYKYSNNGDTSDQELANFHLKLGNTYTIDYTDNYDFCTYVYLTEIPHIGFNSVLFK